MKLNAENKKITLLAEKLFIIRSLTDTRIVFYEARRIWNASPMHATIFQTRQAAEHVIYDLIHAREAIKLPDEEFEIVLLWDAILTYGKPFEIKRKGS